MPRYINADEFYEAKVKTEKIAMLEELKSEFDEKVTADTAATYFCAKEMCTEIIQQKINALKED